jgi:hypothetical protein
MKLVGDWQSLSHSYCPSDQQELSQKDEGRLSWISPHFARKAQLTDFDKILEDDCDYIRATVDEQNVKLLEEQDQ